MGRLTRAGIVLSCAISWVSTAGFAAAQSSPEPAPRQEAQSVVQGQLVTPDPTEAQPQLLREAPVEPAVQAAEPPASALPRSPAPTNPDWGLEETRPPEMDTPKRRATEDYSLRYAARRLALPRGMLRGTFDLVAGRRASEAAGTEVFGPTGTVSSLNFGAALGVSDTFEIGFSRYRMGSSPDMNLFPQFGFGGEGLVSLMLAPELEFGDIPLYLRFQAFDAEHVQVAFDAVFRIPSNTRFGFLGAMPLRINVANDNVAIDTGLQFSAEDNSKGKTLWSLSLPLSFVGNLSPNVFLTLSSGMQFFDLGDVVGTATSGLVGGPFYFIPLGFGGGYSVEARRTLLDLFANFRWPTLYGFNQDGSEASADVWAITIGVNVYSPKLF